MGYPVIIGKLMNAVNANQGKTYTREQLAKTTGLTVEQVSTGMRSLVERSNGRVEVVLRARAWRMLPDSVPTNAAPKTAPVTTKAAPAAKKAAPAPKVQLLAEKSVEAPKEPVPVKESKDNLLLLELLGDASDGNKVGRDTDGKLWGVRPL